MHFLPMRPYNLFARRHTDPQSSDIKFWMEIISERLCYEEIQI